MPIGGTIPLLAGWAFHQHSIRGPPPSICEYGEREREREECVTTRKERPHPQTWWSSSSPVQFFCR